MGEYDPGPLDTVACEPAGARWTLVVVRGIDHPREAVWASLTQVGRVDAWAPYGVDRDLDRPGPVTLHTREAERPEPSHVLTLEPPHLLEHSWGVDVLRWELAQTPQGTRLQLRHTLDDRSSVPAVAAGWHLCLNALVADLCRQPLGPVHGEHARRFGWDGLRDGYTTLLGSYQAPAGSSQDHPSTNRYE